MVLFTVERPFLQYIYLQFCFQFLLPIIQAHPETLTYFMTVVTSDDYPLEVKERMMYLIQDVQLHDVVSNGTCVYKINYICDNMIEYNTNPFGT